MKYFVTSMNEWLYPDTLPEKTLSEPVSLCTLRGGSVGFQVRLSDLKKGDTLFATVSSTAPVTGEIFRELPVTVEKNTAVVRFTAKDYSEAKDYVTRKAPFDVYDALMPFPEDGVSVSSDEAIYVSVKVSDAALPGDYGMMLTLTSGSDTVGIGVSLHISAATLPAESLKFTNWFTVDTGMAETHGTELWSDEFWCVFERYAIAMRRMHQNVVRIPPQAVESKIGADGKYVFDLTNAKKMIDMCFDMGFKMIECVPIFFRTQWTAPVFKVETPSGVFDSNTPEAYEYAVCYYRAWNDFLRENGWFEKTMVHVSDEPIEENAAEYRILSGIIRKEMPGIKIIEAVEIFGLHGAVDIWVPKNSYFSRNEKEFEKHRELGDELWFYTCAEPGGFFCNRLLDMPLLRSRILFWGNYKYNLTGYLHWGFNFWMGDPFKCTCPEQGPGEYLPAGDTHIVYPSGKTVLSSLRGEAMKCGTEDYEILKKLAKSDKKKADEICGKVFRAFDDCDNESAVFDEVHDLLVKSL